MFLTEPCSASCGAIEDDLQAEYFCYVQEIGQRDEKEWSWVFYHLFEHLQKQGKVFQCSICSYSIFIKAHKPVDQQSWINLAMHIWTLGRSTGKHKNISNQARMMCNSTWRHHSKQTWLNHALNKLIITASINSSSELFFLLHISHPWAS